MGKRNFPCHQSSRGLSSSRTKQIKAIQRVNALWHCEKGNAAFGFANTSFPTHYIASFQWKTQRRFDEPCAFAWPGDRWPDLDSVPCQCSGTKTRRYRQLPYALYLLGGPDHWSCSGGSHLQVRFTLNSPHKTRFSERSWRERTVVGC